METIKEISPHERFEKFHAANPQVYTSLVSLARQVLERNRARKMGIGMLYEVLRWNRYLQTDSEDGYRLPNNFKPAYARLIMEQEPDLDGVFNLAASVLDLE